MIRRLTPFKTTEITRPANRYAGAIQTIRVDILKPIPDLLPSSPVERISCNVVAGNLQLGELVMPVFDGMVPQYVLADAISAEFGWMILDQFFQRTLYPRLKVKKKAGKLSVWREETLITDGLPVNGGRPIQYLHGHIGWHIFLQEVWGCPNQPESWFYDPDIVEETTARVVAEQGYLAVDVSDEQADVESPTEILQVAFSVGGAVIGAIALPADAGIVSAHSLRSALIQQSGFELCRAAVREGILGRPFDAPGDLHARLADRRQASRSTVAAQAVSLPPGIDFVDGWQAVIARTPLANRPGMIIPRWKGSEIDTSASRRVAFPSAAFSDLAEAAQAMGEAVVQVGSVDDQPACVLYAPDVLRRGEEIALPYDQEMELPGQEGEHESGQFDRQMFEDLYAARVDPWQFTTPYEQIKYQQSLDLLPHTHFRHALEIGCAEGHFTVQLAPRVEHLVAADISRVALERTAQRCGHYTHIQYLPLDIVKDPLITRFNLIVCSEILYFIGDQDALKSVAQKLCDALEPGGYLLMAHANLVVDEPDRPGYNWDHAFGAKTIGDTFLQSRELRLVKELRTPLYRIHLFQRKPIYSLTLGRRQPEIIEIAEQPALPPPPANADILWGGGQPIKDLSESAVVTDRLPVLMYHRVAPTGAAALAQYRVTPDQFAEQLAYLRDAGYYSITIEEWHAAMREHQPLPGRAVMLTFDDGYLDFKTYAWPFLKKFAYSATVFLVAGEVGGINRWDLSFGEEVPLMGWDEIRDLAAQGIKFGSHTVSHPNLAKISPTEVVREAIRARMILERELGRPVHSIAYPHGGEDQVVRHLIGGCGYRYGFTTAPGRVGMWDPLLALPRIEVSGAFDLEDFILNLTMPE